jgi:hypothetical protein
MSATTDAERCRPFSPRPPDGPERANRVERSFSSGEDEESHPNNHFATLVPAPEIDRSFRQSIMPGKTLRLHRRACDGPLVPRVPVIVAAIALNRSILSSARVSRPRRRRDRRSPVRGESRGETCGRRGGKVRRPCHYSASVQRLCRYRYRWGEKSDVDVLGVDRPIAICSILVSLMSGNGPGVDSRSQP